MSEFHRQCVFSALAVVGGVDGKNVFFPSAQLCGVVLPDAVNIDRVDVAQRTEQPFFTELAVVQLHKVHHAFQNRCPERIGLALPCCHDQPHRFTVERFAHLLVEPESRTNAADAVIGQLLAVIIEAQSHPVGGCEKGLGDGIAAHHLGTELDACRQRRREAVLLGKEQGFLLHGHARVHLAENRQIFAAVAEDAPLDGVLPIRYDELTVAETDLRLVCHILWQAFRTQAEPDQGRAATPQGHENCGAPRYRSHQRHSADVGHCWTGLTGRCPWSHA